MGHPCIDSGHIAGASNTPGDKSNNSPPARLALADEGTASVSRTGVLSHLTSRTDLTLAQAEPVAASSALLVQGTLQLVVAAVVLNKRKVNLVLDELEGAVHLILAPSGHPASHSCAVVELVAELVSAGWQACGVHVRLVQVDVPVRVKQRNVVAQPSCVELRVLEQPDHGVLLVLDGLW